MRRLFARLAAGLGLRPRLRPDPRRCRLAEMSEDERARWLGERVGFWAPKNIDRLNDVWLKVKAEDDPAFAAFNTKRPLEEGPT